jgi:hypothetical protein
MSRTRLGQSPNCPSLAIARCPGVLVETCFRPYCAHSAVWVQKPRISVPLPAALIFPRGVRAAGARTPQLSCDELQPKRFRVVPTDLEHCLECGKVMGDHKGWFGPVPATVTVSYRQFRIPRALSES